MNLTVYTREGSDAGRTVELDESVFGIEPNDHAIWLDVRAAQAHARWVEIHPFVNGNGRTARMWANWILVRYGLPAFVRLRPRPDLSEYEAAGRAALCRGEYEPTVAAFRAMYDRWEDQVG